MPPRVDSDGGCSDTGPTVTGGRVTPSAATAGLLDSSTDVTTIGVKRTAVGQSGRPLTIWTNHFDVQLPKHEIYHYHVISSSEGLRPLPARLNIEIIERLQTKVAPEIFTPRVVYDGWKNIFSPRQLFLPSGSQDFSFTHNESACPGEVSEGHDDAVVEAKVYKVKLTYVATINPEVLSRFLEGKQSHDKAVLTAITVLNVVIRMEPTLKYPSKARYIFTTLDTAAIGGGIVLWRGYFQYVRPAIGRMLVNVDISTAAMYKPGRAIDVALELLGMTHKGPLVLSPKHGFPDQELTKLQRFLSGVRIHVEIPGRPTTSRRPPHVVRKLTKAGANKVLFAMRGGETTTVAQYFEKTHNYRLQFPDIVCIEVGSGAIVPMECCTIPEGQMMRKQVPPEKTKGVVDFAMKKPSERLDSIRAAVGELNYGQSDCMRKFGMYVSPNADVLSLQVRILDPPTLMYGLQSRQPTITPRDGAWNMVDKKCYRAVTIDRWVVVVYERKERFGKDAAHDMIKNFLQQFAALGIVCNEEDPIVIWEQPANIAASLQDAGMKVIEKHSNEGRGPDLLVVVLPGSSAEMYRSIKHFGDVIRGVATQCLSSSKCDRANKQYFANVCLKINAKMGGINNVAKPRAVPALTDPRKPAIIMGAHSIQPTPGDDRQASFAALVSNVDSDTAKYIADCRVQTARREIIDDLEAMATGHIALYKSYQKAVEKKSPEPRSVILYRSGVSDGQLKSVLKLEVPQLKRALAANNLDAKLTIVVVSKGHHVRFFPKNSRDGDKSGNCPAGTVVDTDITHPTEFDFYLQSQPGLRGTSLPAHYHVLYDENELTPDVVQALSFDLCHVYARSTRSVSLPAPVYYARIACVRARDHCNGEGRPGRGKSQLESGAETNDPLEAFRANSMPLNEATKRVMYFC